MRGDKDNTCITLHQPWASLLVQGIKRIEGRSWTCPMRGRLWIHAASKVPEDATIEAMEEFYRQVYAVDGVTEVIFPEHYPVSVLLGCVDVVGCLYKEELENWEEISTGVRLEAQTDFCWLCENPQKLVIPLEMRGRQGVYNLQNKILDVAPRALRRAQGPAPVTFPPLDPSDPFSLKPGCLQIVQGASGKSPAKPSSDKLDASIAGAQGAALQFRKQDGQVDQKRPTGQFASSSSNRRSSSGSANREKSSFQFGQNTSNSNMDRREKERTSPGDARELVNRVHPNDDDGSSGSTPLNASRQAPRRVASFRIFDQAVGALDKKGSPKPSASKAA